jgi:hypothetical protein
MPEHPSLATDKLAPSAGFSTFRSLPFCLVSFKALLSWQVRFQLSPRHQSRSKKKNRESNSRWEESEMGQRLARMHVSLIKPRKGLSVALSDVFVDIPIAAYCFVVTKILASIVT